MSIIQAINRLKAFSCLAKFKFNMLPNKPQNANATFIKISCMFLVGWAPLVFGLTQDESDVLSNYDGVVGTAPANKTISAAGFAVQDNQNSAQTYIFFTQTLANQIYYEVRLWGAYNYMTQNPLFPSVNVSNINNPPGYGFSGFIGYNFHVSELLDLTPYFRSNYLNNMNLVYADTNGNYINSVAISGYLGAKFSFKLLKTFTPYLNFWMGYQQIALSGDTTDGSVTNTFRTATVDQIVANTQIGFNFKVSREISIIPYWQYTTAANYPDGVALASAQDGGFNVSPLTNSQQSIGVKFSSAW